MDALGLPDLLSSGRLSRQVASVSADLARVSEEVATGLRSDPIAASGNDPGRLAALERDLTLNETRLRALSLAEGRAATAQRALGLVQDAVQSIGADLLGHVDKGDIASADREASGARDAFGTAVSALNSRFADRALFSGAAVNSGALAPADQILDEIGAAVAGAPDAAAAIAAIDTYFGPGGGFETSGYIGSVNDGPDLETADGVRIDYAVRADADQIRTGLRNLALGVVGSEAAFAGASDDQRLIVYREASLGAINSGEQIIDLRARLGVSEERIELATVTGSAEKDFLERARNALIARDPFEAAAELATLETQLQSVFAVTARLSRLNLTSFL
ncbi:MAG: flagellin [Pseudomonadota bacterium]